MVGVFIFMITLEQATEWLQEYFQINKMYFPVEEIKKNYSYWENEVCNWELDTYSGKCKVVVDYDNLYKIKFYNFIIPDTKEELFTVLNILEK